MLDSRSLLKKNNKNFRPISDEEREHLHSVLLDMCQDIFDFCDQNGLKCMLGGGSALGAIRHQGFIPWDDDIDLNMFRDDYDKFAETFERAFPGKYEIFVPDGKHRVSNLFMKVSLCGTVLEDISTVPGKGIGISIDIFPIENVPTNKIKRCLKGIASDIFAYSICSSYLYQTRSSEKKSVYSNSIISSLVYGLRLFLGMILSFRKYEDWYVRFNSFTKMSKPSNFCTVPTGRKHYFGEMCLKSKVLPLESFRFENHVFMLTASYVEYLTKLYGDYMVIPEEDKRESHFILSIGFGEY